MISFMNCIYCKHPYTYVLKDRQRKCSHCKRKFSPKKLERKKQLCRLFTEGSNAGEAAKTTGMHVATVQKYYRDFRRQLALHADEQYRLNSHHINGYDEYLYLPKTLSIKKEIHKIQHFLTFSYGNRVYNLMMSTIQNSQIDMNSEQEQKLLLKYLNFNKVAKLNTASTTITEFWDFFEVFILQYKGVSSQQFAFYLKEAEARFNYPDRETLEMILLGSA